LTESAEQKPTASFTELPESKQRDLVLFLALTEVLDDPRSLIRPVDGAELRELVETITEATEETEKAATDLAAIMFREVLYRLLTEEVAPPDSEA